MYINKTNTFSNPISTVIHDSTESFFVVTIQDGGKLIFVHRPTGSLWNTKPKDFHNPIHLPRFETSAKSNTTGKLNLQNPQKYLKFQLGNLEIDVVFFFLGGNLPNFCGVMISLVFVGFQPQEILCRVCWPSWLPSWPLLCYCFGDVGSRKPWPSRFWRICSVALMISRWFLTL